MILLGALCGLMAWLAIAAVVLTSACQVVRIRPPGFFSAMGICFGVSIGVGFVHLVVSMVMVLAVGGMQALSGKMEPEQIHGILLRAAPIALCLSPFISAAIFSVMLADCSFARGLLVWLAQILVLAVIGGVLLGIAYGINSLPTGPA